MIKKIEDQSLKRFQGGQVDKKERQNIKPSKKTCAENVDCRLETILNINSLLV